MGTGIKRIISTAAFTAATALYALPVMAAEVEDANPGLPQLDTRLFHGQLFWLAISFTLLYLLMHFVALPRVKTTQDNRKQIITSELAAATAANEAAKAMMVTYEKTLAEAREASRTTVSGILAQIDKDDAAHQKAQQQDLAKRLHEAEAKITAARDTALKDVRASASDLATSVVEKALGIRGAKA